MSLLRPFSAIALLASGGDPYGAVFTTGLTGGRAPELEVYVR